MLSNDTTQYFGVPLPLLLDAAGMTGCLLGVNPLLFVAGVADAAGAMTLSIPFPIPPDAAVVYAQGLHVAPAIAAGLATTNVTRSILGATGFCSYIYNFTVDTPTAQNGPNNWQGVMLVQP